MYDLQNKEALELPRKIRHVKLAKGAKTNIYSSAKISCSVDQLADERLAVCQEAQLFIAVF